MELPDKYELKTEQLPNTEKTDYVNFLVNEIENSDGLTSNELYEKLEIVLIERAKSSHLTFKDKNASQSLNHKITAENRFILGQFYFEHKRYEKAFDIFDSIKHQSYAALFQLGVILYDDLLERDAYAKGEEVDYASEYSEDEKIVEIDTKAALSHPNKSNWKQGFEYMLKIAESNPLEDNTANLIRQAQYNVGKAYYQGFGIKQSDEQAEKWWILAADDGSPNGCVSAMVSLAFFYSRKNDPQFFDLKKAYFWHNEACGNGSLESQGALGAMYYMGLGCKRDLEAAYECLTHSAERGNVYSMALLCDYYYRNKFYIKAAELSKKVASLNEIEKIAKETNCLKAYVAKGIALASFIQARCLDLGKGMSMQTDKELAKSYYRRSYYFDPDICQLFQNLTTYEKV